ncbi:murein transglycosylase A [Cylindrospermopsis raciborskii]|uniref:peptidoglycan lytic exotransglycosylase n=1 Tax=Cylindrospermopsis raciborskii C07 TaxID=2014886 RepID=A0ABX4WSA9_9CYAN|nr:MltA domain-containing protein [Cylindrospermopsis raciborskii]PNJ97699.1 murein transglycosylase [Cylindrospermopsis raciborskii C03]PNJ99076.1 murein transglycosylase [Cylindrospermopsis raciborskii C04]PNK00672.1 murein transglycosylase [Cylindrospermopsis raciborskii C07]PNK21522.1 murein transglycosylase [Cylindrospermopsis raciborskii S01]
MRKIFQTTVSLPFFLTIFFLEIPSTKNIDTNQYKVPAGCEVSKWDLPRDVKAENSSKLPTLVKRFAIGCCENDPSCLDERIFGGTGEEVADREQLLKATDESLKFLKTRRAAIAYQKHKNPGITRYRVYHSLKRFRELLLSTNSAQELHQAIAKEFIYYQSTGRDNQGTVLFTAYYEPLYVASRKPTAEFKYPVYRLPPDLASWSKPHPTRLELEGADGLQASQGKLKGLELFWLRDRFEPYIIQIQGSARLKLTDGTETSIGYAGNTAHNYKSLGRTLIEAGKLPEQGVTMPKIFEYFHKYPQDLNIYLPKNNSFVFFKETHGEPAYGYVGVPLTPERSIATDKSLMPPGALALIRAPFPFIENGKLENRIVSRFVLDQDTGGAIKGPGRVDYYLGTGDVAGSRAGVTVSDGQLFYLLLKSPAPVKP